MKRVILGAVAVALAMWVSSVAFSTAKIAGETKLACTKCHPKAGDKSLNEFGTCFKEKKDAKACEVK